MDYNLAKKLKEAGFPQEDSLFYWKVDEGEPYEVYSNSRYMTSKGEIICASPTFEEVVKVCGDEIRAVTKRGDFWIADCVGDHENHIWFGETPSEAVGKFWLALQGVSPTNTQTNY